MFWRKCHASWLCFNTFTALEANIISNIFPFNCWWLDHLPPQHTSFLIWYRVSFCVPQVWVVKGYSCMSFRTGTDPAVMRYADLRLWQFQALDHGSTRVSEQPAGRESSWFYESAERSHLISGLVQGFSRARPCLYHSTEARFHRLIKKKWCTAYK